MTLRTAGGDNAILYTNSYRIRNPVADLCNGHLRFLFPVFITLQRSLPLVGQTKHARIFTEQQNDLPFRVKTLESFFIKQDVITAASPLLRGGRGSFGRASAVPAIARRHIPMALSVNLFMFFPHLMATGPATMLEL